MSRRIESKAAVIPRRLLQGEQSNVHHWAREADEALDTIMNVGDPGMLRTFFPGSQDGVFDRAGIVGNRVSEKEIEFADRRRQGEENDDGSSSPGFALFVLGDDAKMRVDESCLQKGIRVPRDAWTSFRNNVWRIEFPEGVYAAGGKWMRIYPEAEVRYVHEAGMECLVGVGNPLVSLRYKDVLRVEGERDLWQNWYFESDGRERK